MADYTPGPWKEFNVGSSIGIVPTNKAGKPRAGRQTEDICVISLDSDNTEANARLIAAAPDLLGAAKEALARLDAFACDDDQPMQDAAKLLRNAIAKATQPDA